MRLLTDDPIRDEYDAMLERHKRFSAGEDITQGDSNADAYYDLSDYWNSLEDDADCQARI